MQKTTPHHTVSMSSHSVSICCCCRRQQLSIKFSAATEVNKKKAAIWRWASKICSHRQLFFYIFTKKSLMIWQTFFFPPHTHSLNIFVYNQLFNIFSPFVRLSWIINHILLLLFTSRRYRTPFYLCLTGSILTFVFIHFAKRRWRRKHEEENWVTG